MPKKKTAKTATRKNTAARSQRTHTDDHSFMIIAGGGLVILMIMGLFFMNNAKIKNVVAENTPVTAEVKEQTVAIKDFAYSPETLTVKVGTTVTWQNNDSVAHSPVADDGTFDIKLLAPGEKGSYTFTKAGTYTYKCGVHPSMTGKIVVEE